jgi:TonB family protein
VRDAVPSADEDLRGVAQEVAARLGVARLPTVLVSPHALTPMTWGVRRPRVLLPSRATEWPRQRLTAVLAHEFAHVLRGDWAVHLLAQIVCAIYWFHPLFWIAERALGRESEQAADDQALGAGVDARDYASHLIAIVRDALASSSMRTAAVAMARVAHLERRVSALLRTGANRDRVTRRAVVGAALASGVLAMPLGAMSVDRTFDVDVRAASLPAALATASDNGWEPMLPFVRRARTAAPGTGDMTTPPAIAEYTTPPLYSDEARRRGIEGIVTIGVHVDERGALSDARVMNGLGAGLDQNALVAVRQWRFRPGTRAGVPVPSDAEVEIEFTLRSEAVNELIANDMATLVGPDVTPPRVVQTSPLPLGAGRASGSVLLDVVLLQNGSPKIVRILRSLSPQADEIAVRHFEQWRFTPAMKRGVPVKVRMNAEVRFHG